MEITLYLEVNLVCIAILFSIYIRDAWQRNNDTYHIMFTRVLFSNILFFLSDIAWGLMSLSKSPLIWANWAANILYFSLSGVSGYFWLIFVEKEINSKSIEKKLNKIIYMLPATILILLSVASIKTHWLFYIDQTGHYARGDYYILQPLLAYILPVYATIRAVRAMKKTNNFEKKRQYRSFALFYLLPAIGGIFQVVIKGTPMLNIGIAISGLWVYFTFQDNVIMLDPLTSMNNRRCFDKDFHSMIRNYEPNEGKHLWLAIMDIDYFKKINDGFGHAEGDRALITVADTLRNVAGRYNCSAARIGGDEFAVCCESSDERLINHLISDIRKTLSDATEKLPFKLQLSIGYSEYSEDKTPQQLFIDADKKLYEVKKSR